MFSGFGQFMEKLSSSWTQSFGPWRAILPCDEIMSQNKITILEFLRDFGGCRFEGRKIRRFTGSWLRCILTYVCFVSDESCTGSRTRSSKCMRMKLGALKCSGALVLNGSYFYFTSKVRLPASNIAQTDTLKSWQRIVATFWQYKSCLFLLCHLVN